MSLKNDYIPAVTPTLTPESFWMQNQAFRNHGNSGSEEKNVFNSLSAGFFRCVIAGSVFESAADGFGVNSSHFRLKYLNMTYNFF